MADINIRASSLASFQHCPRHYASNRCPDLAAAAHPDSVAKPKPGGYRPVVGTIVHQALEQGVQSKEGVKMLSIPHFNHALAHQEAEAFYDAKFTEKDQVVAVAQAMVEYAFGSPHFREWTDAERREVNKYEVSLQSNSVVEGVDMTGHVDLLLDTTEVVDLKTGQVSGSADRMPFLQLAAYKILLREGGVDANNTAYCVKLSRPGSPLNSRTSIKSATYEISTGPTEAKAISIVKQAADLVSNQDKWKDDFTRINARPGCAACAYCTLKGSSGCPETKVEEVE